jgi:Flp pilus assembly protein TadD
MGHNTSRFQGTLRLTSVAMLSFLLAACNVQPVKKESVPPAEQASLTKKHLIDEIGKSAHTAEEAIKYGDSSLSNGKIEYAIVFYIHALELDPTNKDAVFKLARAYELHGDEPLAALAYQVLLRIDPNDALANEELGLLLLKHRRYDEAQRYLEKAASGTPVRWEAENGLGLLADLRQAYEQAAVHYKAALESKPDNPILLNNLGYSLYLSGRLDEAKQYFERAVAIDPGFKRARYNLALVYTKKERFQEAFRIFRQTMKPAAAYNNMGYICMLDNRFDTAEKFFLKAIKLSPQYYSAANENLARVQTLMKRGSAADEFSEELGIDLDSITH